MWQDFCKSLKASINLFLPPVCLLCGGHLDDSASKSDFCRPCVAGVIPLGRAHCCLCARPFPDATSSHLCANCLKSPPGFVRVYAAGRYQGTIKDAVHRLKHCNQLLLARPLGLILGGVVAKAGPAKRFDCILPVPLHQHRLRARGYNQAVEIARPLARQLKLPMQTGLLQRSRRTRPQQGLSAGERRRNLRNAFTLAGQLTGARVLLVDDIMTTGATVQECCRTLLRGGAKEIQVAVVGRA
jgi:ComF family protein